MKFDEEIVSVYPWALEKARRYCMNSYDAEDLASDTIYKALINRDKYDRDKPLKSWLTAIMKNTYITIYNRNMVIGFIGIDREFLSPVSSMDSLKVREIFSAVRRCASRSSSIECVVYYAKGYTYEEISEKLGIPIGTVMSRIYFGRKLIKGELCK